MAGGRPRRNVILLGHSPFNGALGLYLFASHILYRRVLLSKASGDVYCGGATLTVSLKDES